MSINLRASSCVISLAATVGVLCGIGNAARAQDRIGVAACDTLLNRYETCIKTKVAADKQSSANQAVAQLRSLLTPMASSSPGQADAACRQIAEAVKQETATMGCTW